MGDIEIFFSLITIFLVINIIFIILKFAFYKNILFVQNLSKNNKNNFYECGVKPISQKIININVNYLLLSIFFILYDSELLFIVPLVYGFNVITIYDFILIILYLLLIILSLMIDFEKNSLIWQN